ncbi:MAG: hypothetical protein ACOYM3_33200 [Terrimicrobiaceae bacterium]
MPRKPTLTARHARSRIVGMVAGMPSGDCLPTLQILGNQFQLHPSTVFRILRDLATEGVVWQNTNGKFYPAASRSKQVRGLPVCFIGREMWHWSRLYHEILEGVSEVCSANASPLILLSAPSLVRQDDPTKAPEFASAKTQKAELEMLLPSIPRNCGGILFDHLWKDTALSLPGMPSASRVQLLHGSGNLVPVAAPDYLDAAGCAKKFVASGKFDRTIIVSPFKGDPAIDASVALLKDALVENGPEELAFESLTGRLKNLKTRSENRPICLVCPEDNTAGALFEEIQAIPAAGRSLSLFATQGTGLLTAPANRLRFDFRRLGRSAAAAVLLGQALSDIRPVVTGEHRSR